MNMMDPVPNTMGPIELLYAGAEHIFNATQGTIHLGGASDFLDRVRWTEPLIRGLFAFHCLLFLFTYLTRRHDVMQFGILLFVTAIALGAERLNDYAKANWRRFATQDYFDREGLFMVIFVSGPFVLLANFIVVSFLLPFCIAYTAYFCCFLSNSFLKYRGHRLGWDYVW